MITYREIADIGFVKFVSYRNSKSIRIHLKPFKGILVTYPKGYPIKKVISFLKEKKNDVQKCIPKLKAIEKRELLRVPQIKEIKDVDADLIISARVKELSKKLNLPIGKITLRNQKTRWGSCSLKNNISLNRFLIHIPPKLMDYVIIHELTHTKIKNHSKAFWIELEKYYPDCKNASHELRNYKLPII